MGDEDRTEQPTPQEPEPEPDGSAQARSAHGDAAGPPPTGDDIPTQLPGDATTQLPAADHTRMMPPTPAAWEGRAEVRPQHPGLRDSAPYPVGEPLPPKARTWWTPLLLGMLALGLVGLVVLAAWLLGRDASPDPLATDTPGPIVPTSVTPVAPTTQAPSPTPSATPELVEVPPLLGDTQAEATAKLDAAGLAYRFDFRPSNSPRDTVIAMDPAAGARVPRLTTVVLVLSLGSGDTTPTTRPTPTGSAEPD